MSYRKQGLDGDVKFREISVGAETISGSPIGVEIEMNANGDDGILVTKGAITVTDGAVTFEAIFHSWAYLLFGFNQKSEKQ